MNNVLTMSNQNESEVPSRHEKVMELMEPKIAAASKAVNEILGALEQEFADVRVKIIPVCSVDAAYNKEKGGIVQLLYTMSS